MTGGIAKIMSNDELMNIPIEECGEPLVNIAEHTDRVVFEIEEISRKEQDVDEGTCMLRLFAAQMLGIAGSELPKGYKFKVVDGYRPMSAQRKLYSEVFGQLKSKHPEMDDAAVADETDRWVANPKVVPPHTTGGAVDLTVIEENGIELDIGTPINTVSPKAKTMCDGLSKEQQANRYLLIATMINAGFVNNPREWWHWSYGDRRWASVNGTHAVYGPI